MCVERECSGGPLLILAIERRLDRVYRPAPPLQGSPLPAATGGDRLALEASAQAVVQDANASPDAHTDHSVKSGSRRAYLALSDPVHIELQRGIKRVFDPKGLLNPYRHLDERED